MARSNESRVPVAPPEARETPTRDPLTDVADRVRRDAERDPKPYLRSTEVPGGGE